MKKCISYWSFKGGLEHARDIRDAMREARRKGFEAIELCVGLTGPLTPKTTKKECEQILNDAADIGIEVPSLASGAYWDISLTDDDRAVRNRARRFTQKYLQLARWLKVDAVLVVPGAVDVFFKPEFKPVAYDLVYKRSLAQLKALEPVARKHRVAIAVENVWNKFLLSPLEMRDFIDSFHSRYVGAYFDVGNVLLTGFPEQWIRILGHRIKRVHIKDFKKSVGTAEGFCDLRKGDVDWPVVMQALRDVGYDGPVTAEMMPWRPNLLTKTSKAMDWILAR